MPLRNWFRVVRQVRLRKRLYGCNWRVPSAAATGLAALTLKSALAADDLNTLAKQSGFSTADVQKWQYASDLIDVSIDDIVKSAGKMKKNMISTSKTTIAAWDQLGIKVKDGNGHLRNSTTVFYETLTALSKVTEQTSATRWQ